jgi:hypothetical protein
MTHHDPKVVAGRVDIVRRLRNAAHEISTALTEADAAGLPARLKDRIATAAFKTATAATLVANDPATLRASLQDQKR